MKLGITRRSRHQLGIKFRFGRAIRLEDCMLAIAFPITLSLDQYILYFLRKKDCHRLMKTSFHISMKIFPLLTKCEAGNLRVHHKINLFWIVIDMIMFIVSRNNPILTLPNSPSLQQVESRPGRVATWLEESQQHLRLFRLPHFIIDDFQGSLVDESQQR